MKLGKNENSKKNELILEKIKIRSRQKMNKYKKKWKMKKIKTHKKWINIGKNENWEKKEKSNKNE